jgi:rare lipoprotein A
MLSAGSANGQKQTTTARAALATSSGQGQAAMGRVATVTGRAGRQASAPTSTPTLPSSSPQAQASLLPAAAAAATRTVSAERSHTVKAGDTVWELAVKVYKVDPEEILRLNNISDPRALQIGAVLRIPGKIESRASEAVVASWYGAEHHGRPMANGDPYDMYAPTIAHKDLPLGTRVLLENPATGETATATVADRGPYIAGRDVDLSYHLAQRLSLERQGVGDLTMRIL